MELWLLEDMGFAVVAKFSVNARAGEYVTEYRVYKGGDWTDSEISLDLEDLVAELAAMCEPYEYMADRFHRRIIDCSAVPQVSRCQDHQRHIGKNPLCGNR